MRTAHWVKAAAAAVVASGAIAYGWTGAEPAKPTPGNRAELVELGRRLFFDPATSRTGRVSCAACHDPEHGFTDRAHPSRDETRVMRRRAMPVTDVPLVRLHSDGEFADVQALIRARLHDFDDFDIRHDASLDAFGFATYGNSVTPPPALARVADRVGRGGWYEDSLRAAFGDPEATLDRVVLALEAYTYSIKTGENAFDRWLGGDDAALGPGALRGLALFEGKAQCASCHVTKPAGGRAPLTDGAFHDVGISFRTARLTDEAPDRGLGAHAAKSADRRRDHMRFRTPSLRDVAKRGPYMHDGSMRTLADVLDYFDAGGARHRGLADGVRRLALADTEKDDLVAFLLALSAPERAGLGAPPSSLGRRTTVRLVLPDGAPLADAAVAVEPAGDRFAGIAPPDRTLVVRTDANGRAAFAFPPATHVRIRAEGFVVEGGRLLPDVTRDAELVAVPEGQCALRVIALPGPPAVRVRAFRLPTKDALGRPVDGGGGPNIEFRLARHSEDGEALYLAPATAGDDGELIQLSPRPGGGRSVLSQSLVDLTSGALTTVDMRPPSGRPSAEAAETAGVHSPR